MASGAQKAGVTVVIVVVSVLVLLLALYGAAFSASLNPYDTTVKLVSGSTYLGPHREVRTVPKDLTMPTPRLNPVSHFVATRMQQLWQTFAAWAASLGVQPILAYGTLLGYLRHNKTFIPWDDDMDVFVNDADEAKMLSSAALASAAENYGLHVRHTKNRLCKVYFAADEARWFPFVDVFFIGQAKNEPVGTLRHTRSTLDPKNRFQAAHMYPAQPAVFEGAPCFIPADPVAVIASLYSAKAMTEAKPDVPFMWARNHAVNMAWPAALFRWKYPRNT